MKKQQISIRLGDFEMNWIKHISDVTGTTFNRVTSDMLEKFVTASMQNDKAWENLSNSSKDYLLDFFEGHKGLISLGDINVLHNTTRHKKNMMEIEIQNLKPGEMYAICELISMNEAKNELEN